MNEQILVIGSTGKTGRRIVKGLREQGREVREGSRRAPIPFDWEKTATWPAALEGIQAVYISYFPDLAAPGAPEAIEKLVHCALKAGVKRAVLLSGRGEACAQRCEEIVKNSGMEYVLIRASWFFQNFSEGALLDAVQSGVIALPAGDWPEPAVDVEDIAELAVAALLEEKHANQLYEVTGPRAIRFHEVAEILSRATGRQIRYVPVSLEDFQAGMAKSAGPALAEVLTGVLREIFDGRNAATTDGIQRGLGKKPRSFEDFCRKAAASGVWDLDA